MKELSDRVYFNQLVEFMERGIPFNRFLGLRVDHLEEGQVTLRLPFRDEFIGDPGRPALHGGTISMLVDTAGGAAVFSAAEPGDKVSTIDLRVDYLRPGAAADLVAAATVIRIGNRVGVARIKVWQKRSAGNESDEATVGGSEERALIAEATGVYSVRRR